MYSTVYIYIYAYPKLRDIYNIYRRKVYLLGIPSARRFEDCAEQKICLFLCFKPVWKTLVKSEGSPRRAMDRGGLGCQNTSFHEYFSDSKCLLKGQSTQS